MKKTALVTGAAGFIGYHLTSMLKKRGMDVYAILLPGEQNPFADKIIEADIRDYKSLETRVPLLIDYIFHLAAIASVPESVKNPRADFDTNLLGTFNMLEFCRNLPSLEAFVFPSSVSTLERDISQGYSEKIVYGPSTPYGASKMAGEGYCIAYNRCYNIPTKIIRMFNVYGPRKTSLVIYDFIKKLAPNPKKISILGDGTQVRDFLYIDDACEGIVLIGEKGNKGEVYNIASGEAVSIRTLIDSICAILKIRDIVVDSESDTWRGDMQKWYADISKAKALGFSPKICLRDGLEQTIKWYLESK